MSQRRSSRRRNLPSRLQDCDLSGGATVESGEENGQQDVEDLNWIDEVENEDGVEVDEPPGLLPREEEENEEDVFTDAVDGVAEEQLLLKAPVGRGEGVAPTRPLMATPSQAKARALRMCP